MAFQYHNFQVPPGVTLEQVKEALAKWNTDEVSFEPTVGYSSKLIIASEDEDVHEIRRILARLQPNET